MEYSPDGIKTVFKYWFNPIGTIFRGNMNIKDFSAFVFFTEIKGNEGGIFDGCKNLEKIVMPKGSTLQHTMFSNCVRLKEVAFPVNMKPSPVLYETFSHCIALRILDFPETFTGIIQSGTFRDVTAILVFRAQVVVKFERYAGWPFFYKGKNIYVPDSLVEKYKVTDGWNDKSECIKPLSEYQG